MAVAALRRCLLPRGSPRRFQLPVRRAARRCAMCYSPRAWRRWPASHESLSWSVDRKCRAFTSRLGGSSSQFVFPHEVFPQKGGGLCGRRRKGWRGWRVCVRGNRTKAVVKTASGAFTSGSSQIEHASILEAALFLFLVRPGPHPHCCPTQAALQFFPPSNLQRTKPVSR
jgi:hypothetical protein